MYGTFAPQTWKRCIQCSSPWQCRDQPCQLILACECLREIEEAVVVEERLRFDRPCPLRGRERPSWRTATRCSGSSRGYQWRLAIQTGPQQYSGRDNDTREKRHHYVKTHYGPWFDFRPAAEILRLDSHQPEPVRGGGDFQRYDPDFAYRYVRIDQAPAPLTVSRLAEMGSHYLQNALAWSG